MSTRPDPRSLLLFTTLLLPGPLLGAGCDEEKTPSCPEACEPGTWTCTDAESGDSPSAQRCVVDEAGCAVLEEAVDCDDESLCTEDLCESSAGCLHPPLDFDDGDLCNGLEACDPALGEVKGEPFDCDDGLECTGAETCDPEVGCAIGTAPAGCCTADEDCDDANPCNGSGFCSIVSGTCLLGPPLACSDGDPCNGLEVCDLDEGACAVVPGSGCDDGNLCNGVETCQPAGGCQPGTPLVCDDGLPCNGVEACEPAAGCSIGTPLPGCCKQVEQCEDGNVCNGVGSCDQETDTCHIELPSLCEDGDPCDGISACMVEGGCTLVAPALTCDDDNPCNGEASCVDVVGCVPGPLPACDDDDVCNGQEACEPIDGCYSLGNALDCVDDNACNGAESCDPLEGCQSTSPLDCTEDGDPCNGVTSCDEAVGCVTTEPVDCDDGDACNGLEACEPSSGECAPGLSVVCDDGDPCNGLETCSSESQGCEAGVPITCDDEDPCNGAETCESSSGECDLGEPLECNDGDACNGVETCMSGAGGCVDGFGLDCDDGDPLTADSCDPDVGCINEVTCEPLEEVCNNKDDDCDDLVDEDFDLSSDILNCGVCAKLCAAPSASMVCSSGECFIDLCAVGKVDLNGEIDDGCEYTCTITGEEVCFDGVDNDCDGVQDEGCDVGDPACESPDLLGTHLGCSFLAVDAPLYDDPTADAPPDTYDSGLLVVNGGDTTATVSVDRDGQTLATTTVPPGTVELLSIAPSQPAPGVSATGLIVNADSPIALWQLEPSLPDDIFSGDVALVLPTHALGTDYAVLSWPSTFVPPPVELEPQRGWVVIVANSDNTVVNVTTPMGTAAGPGWPGTSALGTESATLQAGEVLAIFGEAADGADPLDLTGALVGADKPVAAFAGHEQATVDTTPEPDDECCADLLQVQLRSFSMAGAHYVVPTAEPLSPDAKPTLWRIQALDGGIQLSTDPPIPGIDGELLSNPGDWVEATGLEPFVLDAQGTVQVTLLTPSGNGEGGDPSMILLAPSVRYGESFQVPVPPPALDATLVVVGPVGLEILVDGFPAGTLQLVGGEWGQLHVPALPGLHTVDAVEPIGVAVIAENVATTYSFWGGLAAP